MVLRVLLANIIQVLVSPGCNIHEYPPYRIFRIAILVSQLVLSGPLRVRREWAVVPETSSR